MPEQDIMRVIGRIEGKLDGMLVEQARITGYIEAESKRIGALEQRVAGILGWASGIAASISIFISFLKDWLNTRG